MDIPVPPIWSTVSLFRVCRELPSGSTQFELCIRDTPVMFHPAEVVLFHLAEVVLFHPFEAVQFHPGGGRSQNSIVVEHHFHVLHNKTALYFVSSPVCFGVLGVLGSSLRFPRSASIFEDLLLVRA